MLDLGITPDRRDAIAASVRQAHEAGADVIVTLGGASVGDHDMIHDVLTGEGMALDFWKIAMRPGKPLMFGRLGSTRVLGLPGNPVASLVCSHLFLKPLLMALGGRQYKPDYRDAVLGVDMAANDLREDYVRATVTEKDGAVVATPFAVQDSIHAEDFGRRERAADPQALRAGGTCRRSLPGPDAAMSHLWASDAVVHPTDISYMFY